MTQENKDTLIFSENDITDIINSASKSVTTFIKDEEDEIMLEDIVEYAKAVSRNEPEYFEKPAKELVLEWALKYIETAVYYGKKL